MVFIYAWACIGTCVRHGGLEAQPGCYAFIHLCSHMHTCVNVHICTCTCTYNIHASKSTYAYRHICICTRCVSIHQGVPGQNPAVAQHVLQYQENCGSINCSLYVEESSTCLCTRWTWFAERPSYKVRLLNLATYESHAGPPAPRLTQENQHWIPKKR